MDLNLFFGWLWIGLGMTTGVLLGLKFENEQWLGGYSSWPRRLIRLGHIAMIALGMLNVLFALSVTRFALSAPWPVIASWSFIAGAVTMPAVCALAAWRKANARWFFIPVVLLLTGATISWIGALLGMLKNEVM